MMLQQTATVSIQDPIILDDLSEPQPDLIVLKRCKDFYADTIPTAEDAFIVIEVSDTTASYDPTKDTSLR